MVGTLLWLNCQVVDLFVTMLRFTRFRCPSQLRVYCIIQVNNSWTSNIMYKSVFSVCKSIQNGVFQTKIIPHVHWSSSTLDQHSRLPSTNRVTKEILSQRQTVNLFGRKLETRPRVPQCCQGFTLLLTTRIFMYNEERYVKLIRVLSIPLFWNGIEEAHADPEWSGLFKNARHINSVGLELRMAFSCRISSGKLKCVSQCLDVFGGPDQGTTYLKQRRARSVTVDGRPYIDQVSPRPEYLQGHLTCHDMHIHSTWLRILFNHIVGYPIRSPPPPRRIRRHNSVKLRTIATKFCSREIPTL